MTTTIQHRRTEADALAWPSLTAQERQQAYMIAAFVRCRRGQGKVDDTIRPEIGRLWPDLPPSVLAAGQLFFEAFCDGWGWPEI